MPKPFPFPITVGTDICHVKRIYNILKNGVSTIELGREIVKLRATRFVHKVLNAREVYDAVQSSRLDLNMLKRASSKDQERMNAMAKFLGGRFAAKEATIKAYPSLRLTFHDITVLAGDNETQGRTTTAPTAIIKIMKDSLLDTEAHEEQTVPLSISHDGEYATAVALGFNITSGHESVPLSPVSSTTPPKMNSIGINPIQQPPTPRESSKPNLGIYTVLVSRLSTQIDKGALLDLFKQQYSSVRWVTIKPEIYTENDIEYTQGFVTFGFRAEAERATKELNGLIVRGQSIQVVRAARNMIGKREEEGGVWLFNDDLDPQAQTSSQEIPRETIEAEDLPPIQKVFQDEPVITTKPPTKSDPSTASGSEDFSSWNTEEVIQSETWDSIYGESIDPLEMSELTMKFARQEEEKKRKEDADLRKEMRKFAKKIRSYKAGVKVRYHGSRGADFKVPARRRGFFVRP